MDNLTVTPKDRRYPDILRYHMFTNITVLYYTNEEYARKQLINYINKEFEYYRDELRVSLKTDLELEPQIIEVLPSWIDGFFDDEYKFNESISAQSQKCKVTFNDGTYDNIDGDVIVDLGEEGYEVMNIRDCEKDMVISYYSGITNIDDMILHYAKYANQWELVIKYSNLWKQKFMDVYQSLIADGLSKSEAIRDISNSCGLKRDRVKAYCEENNHRFLRSKKEMRAVLNFLASRELLTDDDKRNTIHAMYYSNNIPLTFGTALKKELYDYFMNEKASTPILDELCQNNTFKKEEIFSSTIVQNKTIKTIKIIKNNE